VPLRRGGSSRRAWGLWLLVSVGLLVLATVAVVALRFGGTPDESSAPSATSTEARTLATEEVQVPAPWQVVKATDFAARRAGRVSFAVVGEGGALSCYRCRASYHSASVVKAMLLIAYLNRLAGEGKILDADHDAHLTSMIRASDNAAATAIYAHVGDERLNGLARQAGMTDFRISGSWGSARITAADQARLFSRVQQLTPSEYQGYARSLLVSIVPRESWGIPEVSRPEWLTFFKGGWLSSPRGYLVHQVARLEKGELSLTIAILTDGNPSDAYGRETIRGIAARLLDQ
jgi:hypothetical protein